MKTMAILALAAAVLSGPHHAAAEPVPADPVERCRGILWAIPPLTHATATAERIEPVGAHGCRFTGVTADADGKRTSIGLILADRIDFDRIYRGRVPDAIALRVQDIVIRDDKLPSGLGPFDFIADYDLDARAKVFVLRELTLRGASLGELTLSGEVEGYVLPDHGGFWPDADDQKTIGLRRFRLRAVDKGFIRTALLGQSSERDGRAALDDLKGEISANLARWPDFGVPKPAVEALMAFIGDLPSPRRPITISAAPATPIPLTRLYPTDPRLRQTMDAVNLIVTY